MPTTQEKLDPRHTALILVDVQNDFCHPEGAFGRRGVDLALVDRMIGPLSRLLESARQHQVAPIFIQTIHEDYTDSPAWVARLGGTRDVCRGGSWGADFYGIAPQPGEPLVNKHRYGAFFGTRLDSILRSRDIKTLLMAGVATNVCVDSTAREGFMLDYQIVVLSDCTAAYSAAEHEAALFTLGKYFGEVAQSEEVSRYWGALAPVITA